MRYQTHPPYRLLRSNTVDFQTVQRIARMARYWDLVANSGRFNTVMPYLLDQQPFYRFLDFSDWLYHQTGQTHQIALARLFRLLAQWLTENRTENTATTSNSVTEQTLQGPDMDALAEDCERAGFDLSVMRLKAAVKEAKRQGTDLTLAKSTTATSNQRTDSSLSSHQKRQRRHLLVTDE